MMLIAVVAAVITGTAVAFLIIFVRKWFVNCRHVTANMNIFSDTYSPPRLFSITRAYRTNRPIFFKTEERHLVLFRASVPAD